MVVSNSIITNVLFKVEVIHYYISFLLHTSLLYNFLTTTSMYCALLVQTSNSTMMIDTVSGSQELDLLQRECECCGLLLLLIVFFDSLYESSILLSDL